jgi:hypothetical protein
MLVGGLRLVFAIEAKIVMGGEALTRKVCGLVICRLSPMIKG